MAIEKIRTLADGTCLRDLFGFTYVKKADGLFDVQTERLIIWKHVSPLLVDGLEVD